MEASMDPKQRKLVVTPAKKIKRETSATSTDLSTELPIKVNFYESVYYGYKYSNKLDSYLQLLAQ